MTRQELERELTRGREAEAELAAAYSAIEQRLAQHASELTRRNEDLKKEMSENAQSQGMTADSLMGELFAKITGCAKGKGGSMHFFHNEFGMLGGNGIVGSHIPVATGVAFAQKYKNEKKVTLGFYGDGAAQQGAVHEAMNLAGLWRLPVIFVLENNKYGMGTSVERSSATRNIGCAAISRQPCFTHHNEHAKFPLSTLDIKRGSRARNETVSNQFRKCPCTRGSRLALLRVFSTTSRYESVSRNPKSYAAYCALSCRPKFVGERRWATPSGSSFTLSGISQLCSSVLNSAK